MPTPQQVQQQLLATLKLALRAAPGAAPAAPAAGGASSPVTPLLDSLPYYGDTDWNSAHRAALTNAAATNFPNQTVAAQPSSTYFGGSNSYFGPNVGYRDAFFPGLGQTSAANAIVSVTASESPGYSAAQWGNYGVALLSDAIRSTLGFSLDTGHLSGDLTSMNLGIKPVLSATAVGVLRYGFAPTAGAITGIVSAGQTAPALAQLEAAVVDSAFIANVNQAIGMGGDSTNAATWLLYMLWVTMHTLGEPNVDGVIGRAVGAGLHVPGEVAAGSWWTGGYTSWYTALSGADISPVAGGTISASMSEQDISVVAGPPHEESDNSVTVSNGYSQSLCYWGSLAWYNPPSDSCFGQGTGVLMADGSVRPIEQIRAGDEVRSTSGARKVALVETPSRRGRTLYRIDALNLRVTGAHPFAAREGTAPARVAVEPWRLLDLAPTMIGAGVGPLRRGVTLDGMDRNGPRDVPVFDVAAVSSEDAGGERVYDLLLERWERDGGAYYVGGPDCFVAAHPETSDPMFDLPTSVAVITAMRAALESCRVHVTDPIRELSSHVGQLPVGEALTAAAASAGANESPTDLPRIPGPDFYLRDGQWDAHASMLEAHLVRHFGRRLRRELRTGWRRREDGAPSDNLTVLFHDVELAGDAAVPAGAHAEVEFRICADMGADIVRAVPMHFTDHAAWHLVADTTLDFGAVTPAAGAQWVGTLTVDGVRRGGFRAPVSERLWRESAQEHFVFDGAGAVIGRVAMEQRRVSAAVLGQEREAAAGWRRDKSLQMAVAVGQRLGERLSAAVEAASARRSRGVAIAPAGALRFGGEGGVRSSTK